MLSFKLIGWICMEWLREAFNDVQWQLLYGAFLLAAAAACLTLRWDHRRIYFAKTEKGERTRRIDSKHNRMWYWVEFHSRTRVHTPTHYTLQYSHHRQAFKIHACGFSAFSISDFVHISQGGLPGSVAHLHKFATRVWEHQQQAEIDKRGARRNKTEREIMVIEGEKTRRSVLTFYFLFRSYSSLLSVSHIKFSHMMTRFVVSAKPPDCR